MSKPYLKLEIIWQKGEEGKDAIEIRGMEIAPGEDGVPTGVSPVAPELAPVLAHRALGLVLQSLLPAPKESPLLIAAPGSRVN